MFPDFQQVYAMVYSLVSGVHLFIWEEHQGKASCLCLQPAFTKQRSILYHLWEETCLFRKPGQETFGNSSVKPDLKDI